MLVSRRITRKRSKCYTISTSRLPDRYGREEITVDCVATHHFLLCRCPSSCLRWIDQRERREILFPPCLLLPSIPLMEPRLRYHSISIPSLSWNGCHIHTFEPIRCFRFELIKSVAVHFTIWLQAEKEKIEKEKERVKEEEKALKEKAKEEVKFCIKKGFCARYLWVYSTWFDMKRQRKSSCYQYGATWRDQ